MMSSGPNPLVTGLFSRRFAGPGLFPVASLAPPHDTMSAVPNTSPVVAMIGGGQLARMTHQAAIALGQTLRVLVATPDDPAALVTPDVVIGSHENLEDLRRAAEGATAATFDHEHVPNDLLRTLVAEGAVVAPPPQALVVAQDKLVMRQRLTALGATVPRWVSVAQPDDVAAFAARVGGPVVVKTVRGGYDGRGVYLPADVAGPRDVVAPLRAHGVPGLGEDRVASAR